MANLIDFNINQLAIMIVCVHITDVIIFQKMVAGIHLPLRSLCILLLLSQIGGRCKGSKHTRCLECINFTMFRVFCKVHTLLQSQKHTGVSKGRHSFVRFTNKRDTFCIQGIFFSNSLCFVL